MRVRFTADFDYTPSEDRRTTIAYKAGTEETVRAECGQAAVAAGVAEELPAPSRDEAAAGKSADKPAKG